MAPKSLKKKDSGRTRAKASRRVQDVTPANQLEIAIGQQVRAFRRQLHMTVAEVAGQADLSPGMLSKIENGLTSPSLATLKALSGALNVPVTAFSASTRRSAMQASSRRVRVSPSSAVARAPDTSISCWGIRWASRCSSSRI